MGAVRMLARTVVRRLVSAWQPRGAFTPRACTTAAASSDTSSSTDQSSSSGPSDSSDPDSWQRNAMHTGTRNYKNNFAKIFGRASVQVPEDVQLHSVPELEAQVKQLTATVQQLERKLSSAEATLLCFAEAREEYK